MVIFLWLNVPDEAIELSKKLYNVLPKLTATISVFYQRRLISLSYNNILSESTLISVLVISVIVLIGLYVVITKGTRVTKLRVFSFAGVIILFSVTITITDKFFGLNFKTVTTVFLGNWLFAYLISKYIEKQNKS